MKTQQTKAPQKTVMMIVNCRHATDGIATLTHYRYPE